MQPLNNDPPTEGSRRKALLLGIGLDNDDGHLRITRGKNFHLVGGSEETHECMSETAVKLNEKLRQRGRALADVGRDELRDLLAEAMGS
ncbi:MAG: hypothetical protein GXP31_00045 [Kiritimatiellaeota bacterium]|nr:hypothetical protein [Kiritimatiellota bacterium]